MKLMKYTFLSCTDEGAAAILYAIKENEFERYNELAEHTNR